MRIQHYGMLADHCRRKKIKPVRETLNAGFGFVCQASFRLDPDVSGVHVPAVVIQSLPVAKEKNFPNTRICIATTGWSVLIADVGNDVRWGLRK